ncbi:hypothetical protein GCM10023214_25450 [Amycolatopsis dongchuanensis]|uniref:Uncharacterized protein n=1 Tax=Amycolatopsis dongchuanensis TaxID=1070866 RepID=A0ABP9QG06_9PSEU
MEIVRCSAWSLARERGPGRSGWPKKPLPFVSGDGEPPEHVICRAADRQRFDPARPRPRCRCIALPDGYRRQDKTTAEADALTGLPPFVPCGQALPASHTCNIRWC